jgi:hypothetical protein
MDSGKKAIDSDKAENASCGIFLEKGKPDIYIVQSNCNLKFKVQNLKIKKRVQYCCTLLHKTSY